MSDFLGEMQTVITAQALTVTRYSIDEGSKGGSIWVQRTSDGSNKNILGLELIKITIDYEMFDQLKGRIEDGELKCPDMWEILVQIQMSGGNKAGLKALSVKPAPPLEPSNKPQANKANKAN